MTMAICVGLQESISDDIAIQLGLDVSVNQVKEVITIIQGFDPPGVGASDLQDCLLLQLRRKTKTDLLQKTIKLLECYFDEFTKKHYDVIVKRIWSVAMRI